MPTRHKPDRVVDEVRDDSAPSLATVRVAWQKRDSAGRFTVSDRPVRTHARPADLRLMILMRREELLQDYLNRVRAEIRELRATALAEWLASLPVVVDFTHLATGHDKLWPGK